MLLAVGCQGRYGAHIVEELDEVSAILLELPDAQIVSCTCEGVQGRRHYCPMPPASMHKSVAAPLYREQRYIWYLRRCAVSAGALHCKAWKERSPTCGSQQVRLRAFLVGHEHDLCWRIGVAETAAVGPMRTCMLCHPLQCMPVQWHHAKTAMHWLMDDAFELIRHYAIHSSWTALTRAGQ